MEVQTPVLSCYANTDPNLESFKTFYHSPSTNSPVSYFLNTSPEFAMKRLIAAGSGSIYQICKVFRDREMGPHHQPEFTMLEWYRVGFDLHDLIDEFVLLLAKLGFIDVERKTYAEVFETCAGLNPHLADIESLQEKARYYGLESIVNDRASLLDFIFSHTITPALSGERALILYDFPVCQAALARIRHDDVPVAERFELLIHGVEIANGFYELADVNEQVSRFKSDNQLRKKSGQPEMPIDMHLINSLEHGLPDCAGVAVGLDRLFMQMQELPSLESVMSFPADRA